MTEPTQITAGDTVKWSRSGGDYPADDGWALTYVAINATKKLSKEAAADGSAHAFTLSATDTAALTAGHYSWQVFASKAGERYTVAKGSVELLPDVEAAATMDTRSNARKVLDSIDAVIENRASIDQEEYTIGGRSLKRTPIADLIVLRDKYASLVRSEETAAALADGRAPKNRILLRL